jgi:hypothetical protein
MSNARLHRACPIKAIVVLCAPLSLADPSDGIDLKVTKALPSIRLQWTGGSPPTRFIVPARASTAMDVPHRVHRRPFPTTTTRPREGVYFTS